MPTSRAGSPASICRWHRRARLSSARCGSRSRRIPSGETITYAELARRAGNAAAVRAAGAATGRNPISLLIPCHRVVGSDGSLTGYAGGLERKRRLLALEAGPDSLRELRAASRVRRARGRVMRPRDLLDLLLLAALWGGSFLFVRAAVPAFGPFALIELRVGIAALVLLPLLAVRGSFAELRRNAAPIAAVGLLNSALPFTLFAFASLTMTAGFASILNATAPLFGALIAQLWLKDRLTRVQMLGLLVGFAGVVLLVWSRNALAGGGSTLAVAAALCATLAYGIAANYTKRSLTGVGSFSIATGSQCAAALALLPLALWAWPALTPPLRTWLEVILLGVASTGVAYLLYFRLIANVGPTRAVSVTFLIPVFGMLWGALYLGESRHAADAARRRRDPVRHRAHARAVAATNPLAGRASQLAREPLIKCRPRPRSGRGQAPAGIQNCLRAWVPASAGTTMRDLIVV